MNPVGPRKSVRSTIPLRTALAAAGAWKEVDRLAKKWRIPVTVEFVWRQNPKAQHPGKAGILQSGNS